jgi:serine/threonine-protein kinase RsbW
MVSEAASPVRYELIAPLRLETVDLVHDMIAQLCDHEPATGPVDRIRFETAVIEVAANIVEHSVRTDPPHLGRRTFHLSVEGDASTLSATFTDDGRPVTIDFESISMPGADAESGRGLALALAAVDAVDYERSDAQNLWRIVCHRTD